MTTSKQSLYRRFLNFLPVITAGSPGAIRIVVLLVANHILMPDEMAVFSSQFTLSSAFVMLCGIGTATVLIKNIAADKKTFTRLLGSLVNVYTYGMLLAVIICVAASLAFHGENLAGMIALTVSLSGYQVARSYFIGIKNFIALFIADVFLATLLLLSLVLILMTKADTSTMVIVLVAASYFIAQALMIASAFMLSRAAGEEIEKPVLVDREYYQSGTLIGLSNLFSSGISFILPSLFLVTAGNEIAVLASLAASFFSIIAVLPRGVVNNHLSSLAEQIRKKSLDRAYMASIKRSLNRIIVLASPIAFIAVFSYAYLADVIAKDYYKSFIFLLLLASNFVIAQLGVLESNIIYFCKKEMLAFLMNMSAFLIVLVSYVICLVFPGFALVDYFIFFVPSILSMFFLVRWHVFRKHISHVFSSQ
ncbi:hypothetical protein [Kushneria pakistanensis]|nr:hypothetical protein [Kushneria pakistanensis]